MTGQTSGAEVAACVSLAIGLFSASLIPFFLLVEAEHLVPRCVRESDAPERMRLVLLQARDGALAVAADVLLAVVLYLNSPAQKGALR